MKLICMSSQQFNFTMKIKVIVVQGKEDLILCLIKFRIRFLLEIHWRVYASEFNMPVHKKKKKKNRKNSQIFSRSQGNLKPHLSLYSKRTPRLQQEFLKVIVQGKSFFLSSNVESLVPPFYTRYRYYNLTISSKNGYCCLNLPSKKLIIDVRQYIKYVLNSILIFHASQWLLLHDMIMRSNPRP